MILNIKPQERPFVWSLRHNWPVDDGLYYDPVSGELFSLTDKAYVNYLGRLPEVYLNKPQMELV